MDRSLRDKVAHLLKRGLNHYGLGEIEAAIACWENVRELDPENAAARDYLESAYDELGPRRRAEQAAVAEDGPKAEPPSPPPTSPPPGGDDLVAKGLELYRKGRLEEALEPLQQAAQLNQERLDVQGYLELVRGRLTKQYEQEIGDRGRAVKLAVSPAELVHRELGPEEGYLLAQVDGSVTLDELLSLSTVGRFRTLSILARLLRDRIIE